MTHDPSPSAFWLWLSPVRVNAGVSHSIFKKVRTTIHITFPIPISWPAPISPVQIVDASCEVFSAQAQAVYP